MKNKKKLLIAIAAMGFVALGSAGVGTVAWYKATTSADQVRGTLTQNYVTNAVGAVAVNLPVDVTVTQVDSDNLILAMRSGEAWAAKYRNGESGSYVPYTAAGGECYSKAYEVKIAVNSAGATAAGLSVSEAATAIKTKGVKFKVEVSAKLQDGSSDNTLAARTHAWPAASASNNAYASDSTSFLNGTITPSPWDGSATTIGYIVVWVDGQSSGSDTYDGNGGLNTALLVTVQEQ